MFMFGTYSDSRERRPLNVSKVTCLILLSFRCLSRQQKIDEETIAVTMWLIEKSFGYFTAICYFTHAVIH